MEHVPGRGAHGTFDHQGDGQAVQPQADEQAQHAFGQTPGLELGEGAEVGQADGGGRFHGATLTPIGSFR